MLEIKGISVKLKKTNNYLIKNISLCVKDGRLVPKTKLSDLEKKYYLVMLVINVIMK